MMEYLYSFQKNWEALRATEVQFIELHNGVFQVL